ncbi:hypothetical protein ABZ608_35840 [Streptomyces sp. NPDC013172]|uniref:hypothetical protein n=1 Tax=Streptomyces sp. NPDC013172 TaxID=3155009 RepID=UPI0033ECA5B6
MSDDTRSDVYAELAAVGPYGVRPGHALITMVEPHPGHEYAYNRWYNPWFPRMDMCAGQRGVPVVLKSVGSNAGRFACAANGASSKAKDVRCATSRTEPGVRPELVCSPACSG